MKILIDAWLERKEPQIRIIDGDTSSVLLTMGTALTKRLIEHGEINIEELQSMRPQALANTIYRLMGIPVTNETI